LEAVLRWRRLIGRGRRQNMLRKVIYSLASLAAFAMAVGAGWKNA
jgi:hypothetical protein